MFGLFGKKVPEQQVKQSSVSIIDGETVVDIRGHVCPGLLIMVNKLVGPLEPGTKAKLISSYSRSGDIIQSWCKEKNHEFHDVLQEDDTWVIEITTEVA